MREKGIFLDYYLDGKEDLVMFFGDDYCYRAVLVSDNDSAEKVVPTGSYCDPSERVFDVSLFDVNDDGVLDILKGPTAILPFTH